MALSPPSGSRTRLTLLVLASVTLLALGLRDVPVVRDLREGVATALDPVEGAIDSATSPIRNAWHGVTDYDELKAENARLKAARADEAAQQVAGQDAAKQLEDLSAVLDLPFVGEPAPGDRPGGERPAVELLARRSRSTRAATTASPSACRWRPGPGWRAG